MRYTNDQLILRGILEDNNQVARKALKARHDVSIQAQELLNGLDDIQTNIRRLE